jgi:hypothetical protein
MLTNEIMRYSIPFPVVYWQNRLWYVGFPLSATERELEGEVVVPPRANVICRFTAILSWGTQQIPQKRVFGVRRFSF